ncbi:PAS domain S-box protein [Glaciecola sp. SC05]|uniref:PAS domain S-box protein n=1 Tax=Glaciecola sp. SC05 TaxID=1987355 RepID=UPI003527DEC1
MKITWHRTRLDNFESLLNMTTTKATALIQFLRRHTILWYSLIIGAFAAALITITLTSIEAQGNAHINRLTQNSANGIALLIEDDLKKRMSTLSEFTKLPQLTTNMSDEEWQSISKALYDAQRGYQALGWVDNKYHVLRVTPVTGNEIVQNFNLALNPEALSGAMKAQQTKGVAVTTPLNSIHGGAGVGIYVPVFNQSTGDLKLEGFISGLLLFESYVNGILPSYLLSDHQITLFINDQEIYSDTPSSAISNDDWSRQASFQLEGQIWQVSMQPNPEFLEQSHYRMMAILMVLGALLSTFITIAVYTALSARNKANVIKDDRNKVEHLLKNLPGMAYQSFDTADWPSILVSEGCEALTGYTKQEFEVHSVLWGKIIHPDDYDRVHKTVHQAVFQKIPYELEYRIIAKDKQTHLVWERGEAVVSLLNEKLILEGFVTDVTNIKAAEIEVKRSHAFSDAIVESVIEGVITIDQTGKIKSFNSAAEQLFGYSAAEVKNQSVNILMPSNDGHDSEHDHDRYVATYIKTGAAHIIGTGRELEAKRKDGSVFPIHISVNEILHQDGRMFVGLIRDITAQRLSQDQSRKHIEQMAHADRLNSLGEMAAGIAHEVNQPLTAISLFSQSGKSFCNSGKFEKLPDIFEKLSLHARRAGAVLERMQTMTRQGDRNKEHIECRAIISEVIKLAESEARVRDIIIKASFCKSNAKVYVDRVQIQQVLLNLLRNGMEAMQSIDLSHGNLITVTCKQTDDNQVVISVIDTGCGLDSSMNEKLFTAFSSTKQQGMGIGLSISKSIIEDHGGSIHYAKHPPAGSVFSFKLPLVLEQSV